MDNNIIRQLPAIRSEVRARIAAIDDNIASIRTQLATHDLQRQALHKPIDTNWFHRAKTALRHLQRERARTVRHIWPRCPKPTDVLEGPGDRRAARAPRRGELGGHHGRGASAPRGGGAVMAALPPPPTPTLSAIYAAYEAARGDGFREHLGASLIGKNCERALWFDFRWVTRAQFPGRILRLFETGQLEEARLVRNLRATGATVLDLDPETGRQWQVTAHGGHFGGSLDAVAIGLKEAPKTWHVVEFKTHSAKSFRDLVAKGVALAKPQHWAQMQIYMHLTGITRALYVAVCKDTDDLHIERVRADSEAAGRLIEKARRIIEAKRPPVRISDDPAWWECRFCDPPRRLP